MNQIINLSFKCLSFLFFLLLLSSKSISKDKINTINLNEYIGKQVYIFQDSSKSLSFNDVKSTNSIFHKNNSSVVNFGLTNNYNWIKFSFTKNSTPQDLILSIEYPIIDEVKLYVVHNTSIDSTQLFENFSKSNRVFNSHFFLFPLNIKENETVECYLRLFSYKPVLVPISIKNSDNTITDIINIDILSSIYIGIMFVMLLYNLFVYLTTKDSNYIYYVAYIAGVTITQTTILGYSNKYFWPDSSWLSQCAVPLTGAISGFVTLLFTDKFLSVEKKLYKFHLILNTLMIIDIISVIVLIFGFKFLSYHIVDLNAGIGALIILLTAIILVAKNYRPAKFFLIGWIVFIIAIFLYVIKDYGILPYNNLTIHSLQFGSALEAILLSFALADKINDYKKEKEISQAQALAALEENARIINEQNATLERKVEARTTELVAANEDIKRTLTELKEAEAQLVEAEKMASLGQLTAGIAHEINNPINFVTSNIAPLRRDVDMLVDAISNIENVGLSDHSLIEKQQQIEDYKEEIDLDFLKIEINHLLNGINEGATRTADIVKGLKIFSRLDEDDLKKADINDGLESTLIIANNMIGNKIKVVKNLSKNLPLIDCYPGKLNQVFLNMISNAVFAINDKFNNQPGGVLTITTTFDDENLLVKIEDNGSGMSEATKKKIYEPFFTTKDVGIGTGLGMSIVYNTIKKHNAKIYLNSEEGVGTEFIIELQRALKELVTDLKGEQNG